MPLAESSLELGAFDAYLAERRLADHTHRPFMVRWVWRFLNRTEVPGLGGAVLCVRSQEPSENFLSRYPAELSFHAGHRTTCGRFDVEPGF